MTFYEEVGSGHEDHDTKGFVPLPSSSLLTLLPGFHGARSFLAPYLSALELPTLDLTLGNYEPNKLVLL